VEKFDEKYDSPSSHTSYHEWVEHSLTLDELCDRDFLTPGETELTGEVTTNLDARPQCSSDVQDEHVETPNPAPSRLPDGPLT
jgi:hypothetical protein